MTSRHLSPRSQRRFLAPSFGLLVLFAGATRVAVADYSNDNRCDRDACLAEPTCTGAAEPGGVTKFCDYEFTQDNHTVCDCVYSECLTHKPVPQLDVLLSQSGGPLAGPYYAAGKSWTLTLTNNPVIDNDYSTGAHEVLPLLSAFSGTMLMTGPVGTTGLYGFTSPALAVEIPSFASVRVGMNQTGTNTIAIASGATNSGTIDPATGAFTGTVRAFLTNTYLPPSGPMALEYHVVGTINPVTRHAIFTVDWVGNLPVP